jgi:hypothetical protein
VFSRQRHHDLIDPRHTARPSQADAIYLLSLLALPLLINRKQHSLLLSS